MTPQDYNVDILGRIGEKIVVNYLTTQGKLVQESINHYDSEKDMIVDGKKAEVKTQQPFVMKNAFTFRENQLRKCRNVDILYFVSVPPVFKKPFAWGGWLFEADPKKFTTSNYTTKKGINMILVDIDQPALTPIYKLSKEEVDELVKYANSSYAR